LGGRLVDYRITVLLASCYFVFARKEKTKKSLQNTHSGEKDISNAEELVAVAAPLPIER